MSDAIYYRDRIKNRFLVTFTQLMESKDEFNIRNDSYLFTMKTAPEK